MCDFFCEGYCLQVNATKPSASRNESAEIFVVCIGFKPPGDKKSLHTTLDPKLVFKQVGISAVLYSDRL